ncbi:MAG: SpoIIE family protein phosphatase [Turneriella sp.]|nr:SpoIIE family protein phosphatase [Turneriella sp.]
MKIKFKLMLLISAVVTLAVFPLAMVVLYRNESVITKKTFEVCRNLSQNIAKASTEELLVGVTYDSTRSVIQGLRETEIEGLLNAFVVNHEGILIASLSEQRKVGSQLDKVELSTINAIRELQMDEVGKAKDILRFVYPIFIQYKGKELRVGSAVFEFDKAKVYRPIAEMRNTIYYVSTIVFIIAIALAIISAIFITRPILSLSDGARIIGDGNLDYRIEVNSKDEIGQLARQFNEMTAKISDFTNNLEAKVAQRTKELNDTLAEVQMLKQQQDGDYYLTSLLTKPLMNKPATATPVVVEFIVEQKKKFSFKQRHSEIGGDLCSSDSIIIGGRRYTVIINADAMGKSIQGAGGTLVLGAAFKAHIIQAKLGKSANTKPEIWLRDTYRDLQNIFVTFDGTMYISILLGLVDEENGFFYFINAEHPATILYRDGIADFIDNSAGLRKLGIPGEEERLEIRTFQIRPGDVIITGSDGRDDIILTDENGNEYINEDETLILRLTEEAQGDIRVLAQKIKERGKLMDDLSLLSVRFTGTPVNAETDVPPEMEERLSAGEKLLAEGNTAAALEAIQPFLNTGTKLPDLFHLLARIYFNSGDYEKAASCYEQLSILQPENDEVLYSLSYIRGLMGDLNSAADYGECLFLRNRTHKLNLLHLAQIYYEMGVHSRSAKLTELLLELDADNEQARELFAKLQKQRQLTSVEAENWKKEVKAALRAYRAKHWHTATVHFENALRIRADDARSWYRLGICYLHQRRYEDAVNAFRKTLIFDANDFHARNNLAYAYFYLGELKLAREQLEITVRMQPDFAPALKNLEYVSKLQTPTRTTHA